MKYLKQYKYPLIIILLSFGLFFTEFYIFKGYFSSQLLYSPFSSKLIPISQNNSDSLLFYDYSVKYENDSILVFKIKNNGWGCQYITHYRNDDLFPDIQETMEYNPYLYKIKSPYKNTEIPFRFDCGTGLGFSTFCPFEEYTYTFHINNYVNRQFKEASLTNIHDGLFHDIIYDEPVYTWKASKDDNNFIFQWNTDYQCNLKDSIEFQFYLHVHSVYDKKERKIYSNPIKISYCKLIDALEKDLKLTDRGNWNYQFEYISFSEENYDSNN